MCTFKENLVEQNKRICLNNEFKQKINDETERVFLSSMPLFFKFSYAMRVVFYNGDTLLSLMTSKEGV